MKKKLGILGAAAGAAAVLAILYYRREDVSRLADSFAGSAKNAGQKLKSYTRKIKDRLLHDVHGPNGEPVYADMYDRQFYENQDGDRIYLDHT